MPCTLEPWEIAVEERNHNKHSFGMELTDARLLEEVACQACRKLEERGQIKDASPLVQKWWRIHQEKDAAKPKA